VNFFYAFYKVVGPGIEVSEVLEAHRTVGSPWRPP